VQETYMQILILCRPTTLCKWCLEKSRSRKFLQLIIITSNNNNLIQNGGLKWLFLQNLLIDVSTKSSDCFRRIWGTEPVINLPVGSDG